MAAKKAKRAKKAPRKPRVPKSHARTVTTKPKVRRRGWLFEGEQTEVEERIERIADMMLRQEWRAGKSHRALAFEYGVSGSAIEANASEARRHLRQLASSNREDNLAQLVIAVEDVLDMARNAKRIDYRFNGKKRERVEIPTPDLTNANRSLLTLAELHGVRTQRVEVNGGERFAGWSDDDKRRFAETGELPKRGKAG